MQGDVGPLKQGHLYGCRALGCLPSLFSSADVCGTCKSSPVLPARCSAPAQVVFGVGEL